MKFCMVTSFYPPYNMGGDGVFLYRLSNALAAAGHEVHIVHCIDAYFAKRNAPNEGNWDHHPNVTIHRLKSRAGFLSPLITLVSGHPGLKTRKLNEIFEMDFDVIHHHTVSLMGAPALFEMGDAIKLLKMTTYWLVCPTSYLFKYERKICEKKSCFSCTLAAKRPPQLWRYTNALEKQLPHLDMLLANSRFSQRLHADAFPDARVEWLPNFTIDATGADAPDDETEETVLRMSNQEMALLAAPVVLVEQLAPVLGLGQAGAFRVQGDDRVQVRQHRGTDIDGTVFEVDIRLIHVLTLAPHPHLLDSMASVPQNKSIFRYRNRTT